MGVKNIMGNFNLKNFKKCLRASESYYIHIKGEEAIVTLVIREKNKYTEKISESRPTFTFKASITRGFNKAFFSSCNSNLKVLAHAIKTGDKINFEVFDNYNGTVKKNGLHHDSLFARVSREGIGTVESFLVCSSVTENNSARPLQV